MNKWKLLFSKYEEKIIGLIKNKITMNKKNVMLKEAEQIIKAFNENSKNETQTDNTKNNQKKSKIKKKNRKK